MISYKQIKKQVRKIRQFGIIYEIETILAVLIPNYWISTKSAKRLSSYYGKISKDDLQEELRIWYEGAVGQKIDFHAPKSFNEKIQWLKLNDSTSKKTILSDKFLVRDWIEKRIGKEYLIPLIGSWENVKDIDFDKLPFNYVLKCNHGSGMNIIVKGKNIRQKKIRKLLERWMEIDYGMAGGGFQLHYSPIKRRVVAEEYIEEMDGNLHDYKIHCFNGEPKYIEVIGGRNHKKHTAKERYYTVEWHETNICDGVYELYSESVQRPYKLEEMLRIAKTLSEGLIYVRVDLYEVEGRVLFGEMTFTPGGGAYHWTPRYADILLGRDMILPISR